MLFALRISKELLDAAEQISGGRPDFGGEDMYLVMAVSDDLRHFHGSVVREEVVLEIYKHDPTLHVV